MEIRLTIIKSKSQLKQTTVEFEYYVIDIAFICSYKESVLNARKGE